MKKNVVVLLVLAGCNSGPTNATQLYDSLVDASCTLYARCGVIANSEQSSCKSSGYKFYGTVLADQSGYDLDAAIAAKRVSINGGAVNTCLSGYGTLSCATGTLDSATSAACARVYTGMVQTGGTCQQSIECASGFCQQNAGGATCAGVCTAFIAEGASCSAAPGCDTTKDACAPNSAGTDATCQKIPGSGDPCSLGQCQAGLICSAGTCASAGAAGAPCSEGSCANGLFCPLAANAVCTLEVKAGGACTAGDSCVDGSLCAGLGTGSGTCTPVLDIGSACDPNAPACPSDCQCDPTTHVCAVIAVKTEGSACTPGNSECSSAGLYATQMYCDSATTVCTDKVAAGVVCDPAATEDKCLNGCDTNTKVCSPPISECL